MTKPQPVVHFEMPYEDSERVSRFYADAFGWTMQGTGAEMGDYVLAVTSDIGAHGRPTVPGTINGGFFARRPDWPAQHPSVVIAVDDINEAMGAVTSSRGEVLGDPVEIPGVGMYVSFYDTEGNRVSLLQPST